MKVRFLKKFSAFGHVFVEGDRIETTAYEIPDEIIEELIENEIVEVLQEED